MTTLFIIKFGSDWMKTGVVFWNFAPIGYHLYENEKKKKNHKNLKIENFENEKNGLKKWERGSLPWNLAWIHT